MEEVLNEILAKLNSLEQGQKELRHGQQALEAGQKELTQGQQALEAGQLELTQGQDRLENKVDKLEIRMESEVIEKIRTLFDGYSHRGDQIERLQKHIDQRFDSIEIDTGYLVSRVARLEKLAK
ncbi:MAG: hypothetical protein VR68_02615 [Peptococcaceae bacterium BRH_c4a]|nr:MAG: hypothetical protein VR68_02615 [Peptococcaceae bacterium BRH_c4a]